MKLFVTAIRLRRTDAELAHQVAAAQGLSRSEWIRELVQRALAEHLEGETTGA